MEMAHCSRSIHTAAVGRQAGRQTLSVLYSKLAYITPSPWTPEEKENSFRPQSEIWLLLLGKKAGVVVFLQELLTSSPGGWATLFKECSFSDWGRL